MSRFLGRYRLDWSRQWDLLAGVTVVLLALCAVGASRTVQVLPVRAWFGLSNSTRGLAKALGTRRPLKARLTGGFSYAPFVDGAAAEPEHNLDLEVAAAVIERAALRSPDAANLHAWGKAQLLRGSIDGAIDALEAATAVDSTRGDLFSDLAAGYMTRALRDQRAADWPLALEAVDRAIELEATLPEPFFNRALILEALSLRAGAEQAWRDFLARDGGSPWAAEATRALAAAHGQPGSAHADAGAACTADWSDRVYELADRALVDWARTAATRPGAPVPSDTIERARCVAEQTAEQYHTSVIQLARSSRPPIAPAILSLDEAETARARGDLVGAAAIATALQRQLPPGHPVRARAGLIVAVRLYSDGLMAETTALLLDLIAVADSAGYEAIRAEATGVLAGVFYNHGDYEQSLKYHEQSVATYRRIRLARGLASAQVYAAEAARALADYETAWNDYLGAFAGEAAVTSIARRQALLTSPMMAALFQGLPRVSLNFAAAALARAQSTGVPVHNCQVRTTVAQALLRIGRLEQARAALASAAAPCDAISDPGIKIRALAELNAVTAETLALTDPSRAEAAARTALQQYQHASWQQRLPLVFQSLGIALRRQGRLHEAADAFDDGINLIEAYQADVATRERRISYLDSVWDLYGERMRIALDLRDDASAFEAADRGVGRTMRAAPTMPVAALQSQLRRGEVMLLSVVMEDRVVLFAVTDRGLRISQRRVPRERLVRTVRWLSPALSEHNLDEQANAAAGLLSDVLIEPFDDLILGADVLYVVADPLLQSIPFSFLPVTRTSLQRLVDRLPVVMCPSASACLGESSPASPARNGTVAILRQRDGDYLPRLDWEVSRIATLYPRASVVDATAARFTRELGEADILHYAGHAFVDPGFSKRSALLLRRDDNGPPIQIAVDDLITGPIHTRLIVLSACSTLRGREFRGEGMVAASTAFLAAGARNVVGTLWDVRDDAASALIVTFHEQLARGVAPARALWLAQRRAKRDGRPPRDWAFPVLITHDAHSM